MGLIERANGEKKKRKGKNYHHHLHHKTVPLEIKILALVLDTEEAIPREKKQHKRTSANRKEGTEARARGKHKRPQAKENAGENIAREKNAGKESSRRESGKER